MNAQRKLTHIPLYNFLQLIAADKETCTLNIEESQHRGSLHIKNGEIIDAETDQTRGEKALKTILTWPGPIIETVNFQATRKQTIVKPLISVVIEAFKHKLKSEQEREIMENQFKLQQLPTEKFPLTFDDTTILAVEFVDFDCPFTSSVVGMQSDDFIIIRTPTALIDAKESADLIGKSLLVKYIHAGRKTIFKSNVLEAINSPTPLLFISYPESIHFHELRKVKRTAIMIPCTLHTNDMEEYYGMLIDLSPKGALCQIKSKGNPSTCYIQNEEIMSLRCLLPGLKDEQRIVGVIRNMRSQQETTKLGIEFTDMTSTASLVIDEYLYTVQKTKQ